jgi:chemotaxis protein MotB
MGRIRKTNQIQSPSKERWLVSYADYMTLMFALFVVLYASAIVKEETYDVLSESLGKIFEIKGQEQTGTTGEGQLTNQVSQQDVLEGNEEEPEKGPEKTLQDLVKNKSTKKNLGNPLQDVQFELQKALKELLTHDLAKLELDPDWLTIELSSGLLFPSGSAASNPAARVILQEVALVLSSVNNRIEVRGYTDSQSINNEIFSSNWQLSAARAAAVTNLLERNGILQERLAIKANGSNDPVASNETAIGRAKNRRVVIALSKFASAEMEQVASENRPDKKLIEKQLSDKIEKKAKKIRVVTLPNGGIRITTREDESVDNTKQQDNDGN